MVDDTSFRNKLVTPTALTTAPTSAVSVMGMYSLMLDRFNWTNVALVHDLSSNSGFHTVASQLMTLLRQHNVQATLYRVTSKLSVNFTQELNSFQSQSRGRYIV